MAKGDDIQERLIDFAVAVLKISEELPKTQAGRHIAGQLLRSGTAPASNYGEARGAESRRDFVHKLGIVLKELNETVIWLKIIRRSEMLSGRQLASLLQEGSELGRIINASTKTATRTTRERSS